VAFAASDRDKVGPAGAGWIWAEAPVDRVAPVDRAGPRRAGRPAGGPPLRHGAAGRQAAS